MKTTEWNRGDWVVYQMQKRSVSPGPRATDVHPAGSGDTYSYVVEKYWVVSEVRDDGTLVLQTRRGKTHEVSPDDFRLRKPRWLERWLLSQRFPQIETTE